MRRTILILLISSYFLSFGQTNIPEVNLPIHKVTVYKDGVKIIHKGLVDINGNKKIIISDLANGIKENTLSIIVEGAKVSSVIKRINHLQENKSNSRYVFLKGKLDSLTQLKFKILNEMDAKTDRLAFLKNLPTGGKLSLTELKKFDKYFVETSSAIRTGLLNLQLELEKLKEEINNYRKQIDEVSSKKHYINQVEIELLSPEKNKIPVEISYFSDKAFWFPLYNVNADADDQKIELEFSAQLSQYTGLDWNDTEIIFSSKTISQNNIKPTLYPWTIDFYTTMFKPMAAKGNSNEIEITSYEMDTNESEFAFEYKPLRKFTVEDGAKDKTLLLNRYQLPVKYEYVLTPKLNPNAFLMASIGEWDKLNLMPGKAQVYYKGNYVGDSFIKGSTKKEMVFSLGRNDKIISERKIVKDFKDENSLSGNTTRTFVVEISVKSSNAVSLKIEDNIPVSKHEDIEVNLIDSGGGYLDEKTGKITWKRNIEKNGNTKIKYSFEVVYPTGKKLFGI